MDFKAMPTNKKIEYIWDYYKLHIIAAIVVVLFVGYFIYEQKTKVDYVFNVTFLDTVINESDIKKISDDVTGIVVKDGDKRKEALISAIPNDIFDEKKADPKYVQQFSAYISVGELDLVVVDKTRMHNIAKIGAVLNFDKIGINRLDIAKDKLVESTQDNEKGIYAIDISNSKYFKGIGFDTKNKVIVGIVSSKNKDKMKDVLKVLVN